MKNILFFFLSVLGAASFALEFHVEEVRIVSDSEERRENFTIDRGSDDGILKTDQLIYFTSDQAHKISGSGKLLKLDNKTSRWSWSGADPWISAPHLWVLWDSKATIGKTQKTINPPTKKIIGTPTPPSNLETTIKNKNQASGLLNENINLVKSEFKNGDPLPTNQKNWPSYWAESEAASVVSANDSSAVRTHHLNESQSRIKKEGPTWSQSIPDEEMRNYFLKSGLLEETERRSQTMYEVISMELSLYSGRSMASHTNSALDQNPSAVGSFIQGGVEWHMAQMDYDLKRYTLFFNYRSEQSNFNLGVANASAKLSTYGLNVNYYFVGNALMVRQLAISAGLGFAMGNGDFNAINLTKNYAYQILNLPVITLNMKYRLVSNEKDYLDSKIGLALCAGMSFDSISFNLKNDNVDNVNEKFKVADMKLTLGLSVFY